MNTIRWILVIPAAIVATILSVFPLHLVLFQTLTGSGFIEPYPELPERLLTPFVGAIAFVWFGSWVAPNKQLFTAKILTGVWIGGFIATWLFIPDSFELNHGLGAMGALMSLLGAVCGFIITERKLKPNSE